MNEPVDVLGMTHKRAPRDLHTGCTIITGGDDPKEITLDLALRQCTWCPVDASSALDRLLMAAQAALLAEFEAMKHDLPSEDVP